MRLPHLAAQIFNTPLAIEPEKLQVILAVLAPRLGIEATDVPVHRLQEVEKREIMTVQDGIAVIDIAGTLVNRRPMGVGAMSGLSSFEEISDEVLRAANDDEVRGIMLRFNSPGGEAAGVDAAADVIRGAAKRKPVFASVDDAAFSAAFWLASQADQIFVTSTAGVGSIGVIAKHVDMSELEKREGVKVTTVVTGKRKADFSPHAPLSEEALARLSARIDAVMDLFVSAVARGRKMGKKAVRDQESDTFFGQTAIDVGLADHIGTFRDAMAALHAEIQVKRAATSVITTRKSDMGAKVEYRHGQPAELRIGKEDPLVSGHVAVFGEWSTGIGGFKERVMPGAFSKTLQEADIHLYFNHDPVYVLGRNKSGTLRLTEDDKGLYIENDTPETRTIQDLVIEPMRRGDIDQGSFAFLPVRQEWGKEDGVLTRTLHEVRLWEVSILPKGAYSQTAVAVRAASGDIDIRALEVINAKRRHDIALTDEESAYLQAVLKSVSPVVAPGLSAAHPTTLTAEPPRDIATLRRRLELKRRASAL